MKRVEDQLDRGEDRLADLVSEDAIDRLEDKLNKLEEVLGFLEEALYILEEI